MVSRVVSRPTFGRPARSSFVIGIVLVGASLAIVPSAFADPAAGPGAVSRATAGALAAGVIPDGTCAARVTAVGGGGASSPVMTGFGGTGGAGASIIATFDVLPGQSFAGSVGGGGTNPTGGSGDGAVGVGGTGGTIVVQHRGGGGGGRSSVDLAGSTVVVAGGGGGGGAAHQTAPAGVGGGGGFTGIGAGTVAPGSNGQTGVDTGATANGGTGGQAAAGGAGGTNTANTAQNGAAGGGIGVGTGGNGGPDANYDSAGGGGGGYTGGGGGASTIDQNVSGGGGGGGSSWVNPTSPTGAGAAPTAIAGTAGTASPAASGPGATGSVAIDWLPCLYGLSVNKSVSASSVNGGEAVTWTVTITNDGPDAMTRGDTVVLTDLLPDGPNGGPGPSFEVLSFAVSGGANAELARGPVTCTGLTVGASMPASTTCSRAYSAPGAPEAPSGGLRGLDPGETITITYRQVIANTAPCATITNTASVIDRATTSGTTDVVGVTATRSDSDSLTIGCYDLAITKVASPSPVVSAGDTITWTVTVTNEGPADMEGPTAADPNPLVIDDVFPSTDVGSPILVSATGPAGSCNLSGDTVTCAAGLPNGGVQVLIITQSVDNGAAAGSVIANTASVTDPTTGDTNDSSTDQTAVAEPGLTLAKSADPLSYDAVSDVIGYEYVLTNSGDVALSGPFTVDDDRSTDESCPATVSLDPGESITCSASYTITQADLDAGSVTNTATATNGTVTSNDDSVTVNGSEGPGLALVKTGSPTTFDAVGDVIAYEYVVTNTGNVSLAGPVTVIDDKTTVSCPDLSTVGDLDTDLDAGESVTCTSTYAITQADLDADGVTNIATASAGGVDSATANATVTVTGAPTPQPTAPPTDTDTGVVAEPPGAVPTTALFLLLAGFGALAAGLALGRRPRRRVR